MTLTPQPVGLIERAAKVSASFRKGEWAALRAESDGGLR